jgi:NADH dehydrogenase FAD-containing subunit
VVSGEHAFTAKVRRLALTSLVKRGVTVLEGANVQGIEDQEVRLADDRKLPFDAVFLATGVIPPPLFRNSGLPAADDGVLRVNDYLQSIAYPEILGGGECIGLEGRTLQHVGVYAVRQNMVLYENLFAALEGRPMKRFHPGGRYLLILNMGDGRGIFWKEGVGMGQEALIQVEGSHRPHVYEKIPVLRRAG